MSVATAPFFNTYAQLVLLAPAAPADSFYSTEDYSKLQSLGPSLPKLPYPVPAAEAKGASDASVSVALKSIRPPYKFSTLLTVSLSDSVYKVKSELVESVEALKAAGASPANLKFMIKSKVLTDTTAISSLTEGEDLAITVMVAAPTASATSPADPEPEIASAPTVAPATWAKIGDLLAADIGEEAANAALAKFRTVV